MKEERKQRIQEVQKKLFALSEAERQELAAKLGIVTIEGRRLSGYNMMFLWFQNPDCTIVGGYQQWKRAGRQVKKGEYGMSIYIPIGKKDDDGNITGDEDIRFWFATVFDISQTEKVEEEVEA